LILTDIFGTGARLIEFAQAERPTKPKGKYQRSGIFPFERTENAI